MPMPRGRAVGPPLGGFVIAATLALVTLGAATHARGAMAAAEAESNAAASEPARWVKKKLDFTYQGFTTRYSCQGLRDKVREVLLQLGARRSDLAVYGIGCTRSFSQAEASPSVGGTFYVLEPATSSTQQPIEATWQRVNVRVGTPGLDTAGQCELVEQVKQRILPLFSTRTVIFKQRCIPHQLTPNGSSLSVEVLKPAAGK